MAEAEVEPEKGSIGRRASDAELASSSPDFNHMMMRLVRFLFQPSETAKTPEKVMRLGVGALLGFAMLFFVVGLPSMTGGALLLDKFNEGSDRDRAFQLEMFKLQTDVEIKKLDRTMLGDGAMTTLKEIGGKLDQQVGAIAQIQQQVNRIEATQASDRKRVDAVAAIQRRDNEIRARSTQIPKPP